MKQTDSWMPFYVGDYLGDTGRLTTEQHGAYLLLILDYWRNGPPPDEDAVLAAITRLDVKAWKGHRRALERFFTVRDATWRHKRIDEEMAKAAEKVGKRSEAGKAGASKRWGKGNGERMANAMANACQTDAPSPSPSPSPYVDDDDGARAKLVDVGFVQDAARAGGIRMVDPGRISDAVQLVGEWLGCGADRGLVLDTIRAEVLTASEPIRSLRYFDAAVRQEIAKRDAANEPGLERLARQRGRARTAAGAALDPMAAAVLAEARRRAPEGAER